MSTNVSRSNGAPIAPGPLLSVESLSAGYGRAKVLQDLSLHVNDGEVVALLGANGAGKTTLLRSIAGQVAAVGGRIVLDGRDVTTARPERRARHGLCLVPEGRGVFPGLTVKENLALQRRRGSDREAQERALEMFPVLKDRLAQVAGSMSGGQQQMLALACGISASPKVVLLDEVSMGLAPRVVDEIFEALRRMRDTGVAMLVVEQYVAHALAFADRVYLLDRGEIAFAGKAEDLDQAEIARQYLASDTV